MFFYESIKKSRLKGFSCWIFSTSVFLANNDSSGAYSGTQDQDPLDTLSALNSLDSFDALDTLNTLAYTNLLDTKFE